MLNMNERMGAPWWHYVASMLVGWMIAALVYTY